MPVALPLTRQPNTLLQRPKSRPVSIGIVDPMEWSKVDSNVGGQNMTCDPLLFSERRGRSAVTGVPPAAQQELRLDGGGNGSQSVKAVGWLTDPGVPAR
jgi:hypothetical protein